MKQNRLFSLSHISWICLARTLIRHCWMVVAAALIFNMAASLIVTHFHTPQYRATMTYSVNSRTTSVTSVGNLTSTREAASVLTELLQTNVMKESIQNHDPRLADFNGTISASQVGDTNFIVVTATADTPERAFLSLKALIAVFPELASFISSRSVLNIMRNPTVSSSPSNQVDADGISNKAGLIGAVLMAVLLCYMSVRNETIQTRTGARQLLDAPIISCIHHERKNRTFKSFLKRSNTHVQVFSPTASFSYVEQISTICTHMEHQAAARQHKLFLMAGVGENEGKSTVSGNVAAALALKGHKVALMDCDLRNPSIHRFLGGAYHTSLPLNKLLAQPYSTENLKQCMVHHEQLGLYTLLSTTADSRCTELLSGQTMQPLLEQLRVFDFVIIDTPPMSMFPDTEILADMVDTSMLVVRQDYTAACDVNDAIDALNNCKCEFSGCILNDMRITFRSMYGYGSKYGKNSKGGYTGKYAYDGRKHSKSVSRDS